MEYEVKDYGTYKLSFCKNFEYNGEHFDDVPELCTVYAFRLAEAIIERIDLDPDAENWNEAWDEAWDYERKCVEYFLEMSRYCNEELNEGADAQEIGYKLLETLENFENAVETSEANYALANYYEGVLNGLYETLEIMLGYVDYGRFL